MTKEKFKTKATETFARVVQGAKKGVVKAHCEMLRQGCGLLPVKLQKTLAVYFFCFAKSKLADLFGSLEESSSRFASQLDPLWPPEDAGRG